MAHGSVAEVQTALYITLDLSCMTTVQKFQKLYLVL
ncbi:MAG: hypothetical protein ABI462_01710 [Ignavibacteria bacterium]